MLLRFGRNVVGYDSFQVTNKELISQPNALLCRTNLQQKQSIFNSTSSICNFRTATASTTRKSKKRTQR